MSPEQARGQTVDARSDVWAFGCVFYEMLSGSQTFIGDTLMDVLGGIVRGDPDWTALPAETPPLVRLLLRQCLQKQRNVRLRHIGDAKLLIDAAQAEPPVPGSPRGAGPRRPWPWIAATLLLLLALVATAAYFVRFQPDSKDVGSIRFSVSPPEKTSFN